MTASQVSPPPALDGSCLADAIRWRMLLLLQDLDVPGLCEAAGIDHDRLKEQLADARPSAELVAWVALLAGVPVAEVMFGPSPQTPPDAGPGPLARASDSDLMLTMARRLEALDARIERALHALVDVETRLSAAGLSPSDLIPPEMAPLYAGFLPEAVKAGA